MGVCRRCRINCRDTCVRSRTSTLLLVSLWERPRIRQVIVDLIIRLANENPTWGYDRIQGALANVGYHISDSTVANVPKAHGIEPAPNRGNRKPQ